MPGALFSFRLPIMFLISSGSVESIDKDCEGITLWAPLAKSRSLLPSKFSVLLANSLPIVVKNLLTMLREATGESAISRRVREGGFCYINITYFFYNFP